MQTLLCSEIHIRILHTCTSSYNMVYVHVHVRRYTVMYTSCPQVEDRMPMQCNTECKHPQAGSSPPKASDPWRTCGYVQGPRTWLRTSSQLLVHSVRDVVSQSFSSRFSYCSEIRRAPHDKGPSVSKKAHRKKSGKHYANHLKLDQMFGQHTLITDCQSISTVFKWFG